MAYGKYWLNDDDWRAFTDFMFDLHSRNPRWRDKWVDFVGGQEEAAKEVRVRGGLAIVAGGHWADVTRELQVADLLYAGEETTERFVLGDVPVGIYSAGADMDQVLLTPGPYPDEHGHVDPPSAPWDVRENPFRAEMPLTPQVAIVFRSAEEADEMGTRRWRQASSADVAEINARTFHRAIRYVFGPDEEQLEALCAAVKLQPVPPVFVP